MNDPRRELPSVEQVIEAINGRPLPHALLADTARRAVEEARAEIEGGTVVSRDTVIARAHRHAEARHAALLGGVVNATGVLLHTNLGRAPLGETALAAIRDTASYSNLEYRLDTGGRGSRHAHAANLLAVAVGAEAGIAVNNNAAAVMLVLSALARGREVVVSRGELVEIGGGFRVPDVLRESGARLVEVGTTNRTRTLDFAGAMSPSTALLLRVHASNYRMIGFTEQPSVADLAALGAPVVVDAGSGLLDTTTPWLDRPPAWLRDEPGVRQCLAGGARLVTFSGDKLLGGPQAGVIVGDADLVERCAQHPLARALRADKLTLAALQAVALAYLDGDVVAQVPFWRMATQTLQALRDRAERVAARVAGAKVIDTEAAAGGGSLPGLSIPSVGVATPASDDADRALAALRVQRVVALVRDGHVVADLRSVDPGDDDRLADTLASLTR
jgi:L-seryl-tRNA(Ser) seleniumtransferase